MFKYAENPINLKTCKCYYFYLLLDMILFYKKNNRPYNLSREKTLG